MPVLEKNVYDFNRCKLCAKNTAVPTYKLKNTTIYVCAACGFHFINHLDTMPSNNQSGEDRILDRKSYDYIEGKLIENGKQLAENLRTVKKYHPLHQSHCLDIGAGAGLFSHLMAEEGALVHGIEPQKIFREFALKKYGISLTGETVDDQYWQQGFAGFFDVVTLWDVLEHVNFPAETLAQLYNVAKEGGWLFLDTPRRDSFFYKMGEWSYRFSSGSNRSIFESIYSSQPFRHKQLFTLNQLIQLVEKVGFSVISMNASFFKPQNKMILVCRKPLM
jgi:2-polyprenyl-6-hydroxyphenyl methylase/3-demethylubiquinone-9 3-methyltransferase